MHVPYAIIYYIIVKLWFTSLLSLPDYELMKNAWPYDFLDPQDLTDSKNFLIKFN